MDVLVHAAGALRVEPEEATLAQHVGPRRLERPLRGAPAGTPDGDLPRRPEEPGRLGRIEVLRLGQEGHPAPDDQREEERVAEGLDALEVVIPNLNWRYSGGTAVNRTIAPLIAKRWRAAWFGPDRPDGIATLSLSDLVRLRFRPPNHGKVRIWHARRNVEMLAGLFLNLLGYGFALIFNSASQRKKTWLTNFLIARMDAVIATSEAAAQYLQRPATVIHHGIDVDLYSPPPTGARLSPKRGCPENMALGRSAGCDGRKAPTCLLRRCVGCCRNIPISPPS